MCACVCGEGGGGGGAGEWMRMVLVSEVCNGEN